MIEFANKNKRTVVLSVSVCQRYHCYERTEELGPQSRYSQSKLTSQRFYRLQYLSRCSLLLPTPKKAFNLVEASKRWSLRIL